MYQARVKVMFKKGVLDPQGEAVKNSLMAMGYEGVHEVRIGKYMTLNLENRTKEEAEKNVEDMCEKLLSNPVIEDYDYELTEA